MPKSGTDKGSETREKMQLREYFKEMGGALMLQEAMTRLRWCPALISMIPGHGFFQFLLDAQE